MKFKPKRVKRLAISLLAFTWFLASAGQTAAKTHRVRLIDSRGQPRNIALYSGYYAFVVGCSDYRNGWPRLPNALKDAREVAATLEAMGWQVDLLEDPDGFRLQRSLNKLMTTYGKQPDLGIVVWYSGHGYSLKEADGTNLGYIVPIDAPDPQVDELGFLDQAVSMRRIETLAKRIQSKHVLMIFDSCFSGAIFRLIRAIPSTFIEEKTTRPVRQFITAGTEDESVPDRSVFKNVFLQAIQEGYADRNRDGYITGEELGAYLAEEVVNYTRGAQHPQYGKINNPKLDKGDFVFIQSKAVDAAHRQRSGAPQADIRAGTKPAERRCNLSLFPWRFRGEAADHYTYVLADRIVRTIERSNQWNPARILKLDSSFFHIGGLHGQGLRKLEPDRFRDVALFAGLEPDIGKVLSVGRAVKADAVLTGRMRISGSHQTFHRMEYLKVYLIDVATGEVYDVEDRIPGRDVQDKISRALKRVFHNYTEAFKPE